MPKLKTNKAAAKRFKSTAGGSYKHGQSHKRHILTKKSSKRKRQLRATHVVSKTDVKRINQMLPNG
jgi:large subunit ribosomal protein L35